MKKSFIMAVAAIAALSSCSNDDILSTENGNNTAKAPVFTATIESEGNTRTVLSNNKVEWTNTDKVFIGAFTAEYVPVVLGEYSVVPGSNATSATLNPGSDLKYTAEGAPITTVGVYPASISFINGMDKETIASYAANQPMALMEGIGAIVLPATQTYNGNDISKIAPMVGVGSTELQFSNLTALLAISVPSTQITSVQKITISGDIRLNGNFGISFVEGEAKLFPTASPTDAEKKITLDCQSEGANTTIPSGGSKTFYVSIPANTYSYLQIDVTDGTSTKTMKTKASSITVARNNIYNIAFEDNQTPAADPNLLAGVFSVSPTKKVKFTKANLYWNGSAYQFEADQTNYPEKWNTSHIGHFYWSQTAAVAYEQTYSDGSRGTTDKLFCGEDNKLTVSGTSDLYVLSAKEWHYLTGLYNDASYSGNRSDAYRFANARVNGVAGLLIFPDGYNGTVSGDGIATVNKDDVQNADYPSASIPDATWSAMEAAGVVFLPAAGCRSGKIVDNCGNNGYYWSSTLIDKGNAYILYDYYGIVDCPKNQDRYRGCSIRLVKTVPAQ